MYDVMIAYPNRRAMCSANFDGAAAAAPTASDMLLTTRESDVAPRTLLAGCSGRRPRARGVRHWCGRRR
jgi:hypothetical protein